MKKLKHLVLSIVVGFTATSFVQSAKANKFSDQGVVMVFDPYGHEVPFPTKAIIRFPWELIEGFWAASISEVSGIFRFMVDSRDSSHKKLSIQFLDMSGSRILAQGYGSLDETNKVLNAKLIGPKMQFSFHLSAFRLNEAGYVHTEMVTSFQMAGSPNSDANHNYVIRKIRQ